MATLSDNISSLATRIANYIRDSILPRLLPSGGTSGQVLSKTSATNYAVGWSTGGGGETNTASNLGAGNGVFSQKVEADLQFKSLIAGTNCSMTATSTTITVNCSATATTLVAVSSKTAAYTLALVDAGTCVEINKSSALVVTIPPNSSVAFPVGTTIMIRRMGTGTVTLAAGSGVTIRNPHATLKINARYGCVTLHQRAANEWCLEGNLAEV